MRSNSMKIQLTAACAGAVLALSGCSQTGTSTNFTSVGAAPGQETETGATDDAADNTANNDASADNEDWVAAYEYVLDNPGEFEVSDAASYDPTGDYTYALAEATGGGAPELLLHVDSYEYSPVIVFTIGPDGKAVGSEDVLISGMSGAGGSQTRIDASASGVGLHQVSYHPRHPEFYSTTFVLDGRNLKATTEQTEYPSEAALPDHMPLQWYPVSNKSGLRIDGAPAAPGTGNPGSGNPGSLTAGVS